MANEKKVTQLLANQPIELTPETDFFNTIPKGDTIVSFIDAYSESLKDNKLIALYGDWGTGKTSLIKYIQKELKAANYKTIYFETWKYEKDDNLSLSLVDVIVEKVSKRSKAIIRNFRKVSASLLLNFAKSISFQTPIIQITPNEMIKGIEEETKQKEEGKSYHQKIEEFSKSYLNIEKQLLKGDAEHIIIFIDDLDRCEPENILNLLTALKHFFSHGKNTIFFCGIDKDAVTKAVKHKYKDVVKSVEYLEKIFDISFNMPKNLVIRKFLEYYFADRSINVGLVEIYLNEIDFITPRHLKKVLNKLLTLKFIQRKGLDFEELIPSLKGENSLNVIFVIHFIILFEFKKKVFFELKDLEDRMYILANNNYNYDNMLLGANTSRPSFSTSRQNFKTFEPSISENIEVFKDIRFRAVLKAIHLILLIPDRALDVSMNEDFSSKTIKKYIEYLDNFVTYDNIQVDFAKFILTNQSELKTSTPNYKFMKLFEMAEKYL
jgi:GTPase SAR1 family protein